MRTWAAPRAAWGEFQRFLSLPRAGLGVRAASVWRKGLSEGRGDSPSHSATHPESNVPCGLYTVAKVTTPSATSGLSPSQQVRKIGGCASAFLGRPTFNIFVRRWKYSVPVGTCPFTYSFNKHACRARSQMHTLWILCPNKGQDSTSDL